MTMRAIHTDSDRWFLKPAVVAGAGLLAVVSRDRHQPAAAA